MISVIAICGFSGSQQVQRQEYFGNKLRRET